MAMLSFSQRQLNPYRGVMRVIRHAGAEAVTQDGWHWDLYVSNQALLEGLGDDIQAHRHRVLISDIRFGRWSPDHGLKRGPIYPSADFRRMEQEGAALFNYLIEAHAAPIFPFIDIFELWLLDTHLRPLALLASATEAAEMDLDLPLTWLVGDAARANFRCAAVADAAEVLASQVRQFTVAKLVTKTATKPAAIWVRRELDGSATVMAAIQVAIEQLPKRLPAAAMPRYFLAETGHGEDYARLVRDYLDWQAPCLLMLPSLSRAERQRLEHLARHQAEAVEKHHRLYPESVDEAQIQAARVEAMLCRTQPERVEEYGFASTFYIELEDEGIG
jgi:hypothetical protein